MDWVGRSVCEGERVGGTITQSVGRARFCESLIEVHKDETELTTVWQDVGNRRIADGMD